MFIIDTFFWTVFGAMLLVHLLYYFHWQGEFIGVLKAKYDFLLFVHCITYALCISAVLFFFGILTIPKFLFLLASHWVIDKWKCLETDQDAKLTTSLWVDQFAHIIVLIVLVYGA